VLPDAELPALGLSIDEGGINALVVLEVGDFSSILRQLGIIRVNQALHLIGRESDCQAHARARLARAGRNLDLEK
jgi:hypothetical protein